MQRKTKIRLDEAFYNHSCLQRRKEDWKKDILLADKFLSEQSLSGEIIVIDDGSSDATFDKANSTREKIRTSLTVFKNKDDFW